MKNGFQTAYGVDFSPTDMLVTKATRATVSLLDTTGGNLPEIRDTIMAEVNSGKATLSVQFPAAQTTIRPLQVALRSKEKAGKVFPSLLDIELPFPIESAICLYQDIHVREDGIHTLALAIRQHDMESLLSACDAAGFQPTHCDAESLALWEQNRVEYPAIHEEAARILVDISDSRILIIRGTGRQFLAAHVLRTAYADWMELDSAPAWQTWRTRMAQIIDNQTGKETTKSVNIWWSGRGALQDAFVSKLQKSLSAVQTPLRHSIVKEPATLLSRALARRALDDSAANFRSGPQWQHPALLRQQAKAANRTLQAIIGISMILILVNIFFAFYLKNREAYVQAQLTQASHAIAPHAPKGMEWVSVQRALQQRETEMRAFQTSMDPNGEEYRLYTILNAAQNAPVEITDIRLMPNQLSATGNAGGIQPLEKWKASLQLDGWNVQIQTSENPETKALHFQLKATREAS